MSKSASKPTSEAPYKPTMAESIRETVDSIVIAFVLAFLFRTFEAEAFVIPTGSMAPTLMGDHKDLNCVKCGYPYRVSASNESPNDSRDQQAFVRMSEREKAKWQYDHTVISALCPNCRYRMNFDDDPHAPLPPDAPMPSSFKGDRILVTKYSYEFGEPSRWDVAVFKNPSQAKINYIKRIVGLPGEEVLIYRGDIYTRTTTDGPYRIARKPHDKAEAMAQVVYDNDYVLPEIHERGWPERWANADEGPGAPWKPSDDLKRFSTAGGDDGDEAWLRYRHYVPGDADWATLAHRPLAPDQRPRVRPQLISDFCEYNGEGARVGDKADALGRHWVGDIAIECELTFGERRNDDAEAVLEIVEGGRAYQCRIRAASGDAVLSIAGVTDFRPTAKGAFAGQGPRKVRFANVDDQLLLWIDGKPVTFDAGTTFQTVGALKWDDVTARFDDEGDRPPLNNLVPTQQDVGSPIGIAAKGCALEAAHLRVLRDVYYVADRFPPSTFGDHDGETIRAFDQEYRRRSLRADPPGQAADERQYTAFLSDVDLMPERFEKTIFANFQLAADQFFVLGDNSPRSLDARLWNPPETYVARELLIGKALFVYWPHALEKIPGTSIPFPFFPNFARMRMIR
jgi:signal peptidase I